MTAFARIIQQGLIAWLVVLLSGSPAVGAERSAAQSGADNPQQSIQWRSWSPSAFEQARASNKPGD